MMSLGTTGPEPTGAPVVDTSRSPSCRLRPVGVAAVRVEDAFWAPRFQRNRTVTLPSQHRQLESTGRLDNFRRAAGMVQGQFVGRYFNDSDVYKWVEAAAWTLASGQDAALRLTVDEVVNLIAAAQDEDGYLNTYFTFERRVKRWTNLADLHELYCAGHLMQAAVAHHRATGSRALLDVAVRLADHICRTFGPGARSGTCGHPQVEMALVELWRETGAARYLQQAQLFLDRRGQSPPLLGGDRYLQDHEPLRRQRSVVGHAVRALYLYSGATDVYAETGDRSLWDALEALWYDLQAHKAYITGGVGSRYEGEAVGEEYELPNERAYAETCAAIAHVMWGWRLLLVTGEARYADALETALYNGVLAGVSLDGESYFYQNPLADAGRVPSGCRRVPWFTTACCPPNVARLLASLPGYVYATSPEGLWVHLYVSGNVTTSLLEGQEVTVTQSTAYPWDGEIELRLEMARPATFSLFLRVPGWCPRATAQINGEPYDGPARPGAYAEVRRRWERGDVVRLSLPMPVRRMASHPRVANNHGRVALTRGPLVYCLEQADHVDADIRDVRLRPDARWEAGWEPDLLGGVIVLRSDGLAAADGRRAGLYYPYDPAARPRRSLPLTAVPYYAWANRATGPMQVWIPLASL